MERSGDGSPAREPAPGELAILAAENARLQAQARGQQAWQQAMADVTGRLLAEDEPRDVLDLVTRYARELSGVELVQLAVPTPDGEHLELVSALGAGSQARIGQVYQMRGTLAEIVLGSGRPLVIDDFATDERVPEVGRQALRLGPAVVFPLGPRGDVRGVLTAGQPPGSPALSQDKVEIVTTFAAQAGIRLKLAEHRRNAERLARLADRDRIARDLHDHVIQRLFATGMSLQGATSLIPGAEAAGRVQQAVDELDETIRDIRAAIFRLQDRGEAGAEPPGVQARIAAITEEMTRALGFAPWLRMDGRLDARVPARVAEEMLAVLREALSNVARHAAARRVDVSVETGSHLTLTVRDHGPGFPPDILAEGPSRFRTGAPERGRGHGLGLTIALGQARVIGARLEFGDAVDGGAIARVRLPRIPDSTPDT